ncbi:helix-turn-helix transcriptional regulator [Amycolatopsis sp.]|jgi:transcriptional regulator with XRE-family HTH domain|uniref:helix-turn-helix domain-containing protein n=1 Tax=Amycolatopsis sp. TaxID=37632 RepID=UPI002E029BA7|nr:helix-turn-helix transcriptional regulator [Amycolatopsis sp.]
MTRGKTPLSQLRRLRSELRQERDRLQLTQKDVADSLDWSPSKLIRIENGTVGISITDLKALLLNYKITDEGRVEQFVAMARAGKEQAWWHKYRDNYSKQFLTFLGLESSAIRLRQFQNLAVPGILQTRDYARVLVSTGIADEERIENGVAVRLQRQKLLEPGGPDSYFILDESVLRRQVGGPEVMRDQLKRLKELAALDNVTIQVVPFSAGRHRGLVGSFEIFELSDQEDDYALMLEQPYKDVLIEDSSEETREYVVIFRELEKVALSEEETVEFIDQVLAEA